MSERNVVSVKSSLYKSPGVLNVWKKSSGGKE